MRTAGVFVIVASLLSGCIISPGEKTTAELLQATRVDFTKDAFSKDYEEQFDQYAKIYATMKKAEPGALKDAMEKDPLLEYVGAGLNYVDGRCTEYFNILRDFQKRKREASTNMSIGTALLSGVLAAAKAKASEIAILAITGSSSSALIDNYGSSLLFELDPSTTHGLVERALAAYRNDLHADEVVTFSDAVKVIQGYALICIPTTIEKMVTDAVKKAEPVAVGGRTDLQRQASAPIVARIAGLLELQTGLSETDVDLLYWLLPLGGGSDKKTTAYIRSQLPSSVSAKLLKTNDDALLDTPEAKSLIGQISAHLQAMEATDTGLSRRAERTRQAFMSANAKPVEPKTEEVKKDDSPATDLKPGRALKETPPTPPAPAAPPPATRAPVAPPAPRVDRFGTRRIEVR